MGALGAKEKRSHEVDMCNGSLLPKIVLFAIPVMLSGILQLLFNAADLIVVGRFAGDECVAAVGSTSSLINLLVNLFMGLSVGTNVLVARYFGAGSKKDVEETVHTSILTALLCGIVLAIIGLFLSKPLLHLMGSPDDVLPLSAKYLKVYFIGMPAMLIYNFGAAILRAIGDTKRPMIFLTIAGVLNVLLNLMFVIVFKLNVVGVALATTISQCLSATLVVIALINEEGMCKLTISKLRICKNKLLQLMKVGLPAGLQGSIFSISNVLIQSSVNSFGSLVMAGNSAAQSLEGFVYMSMNAFHQTAVSFTSQNYGAKKVNRIKRTALYCILLVTAVGFILGILEYLLGRPLLSIYLTDQSAVKYGILRMLYICVPYCLCGIMDTLVGVIRGLGYSIMPMIVSLLGACAFRVVWIFTIFAKVHTLEMLYISYPVSWLLTAATHMICLVIVWKKGKAMTAIIEHDEETDKAVEEYFTK